MTCLQWPSVEVFICFCFLLAMCVSCIPTVDCVMWSKTTLWRWSIKKLCIILLHQAPRLPTEKVLNLASIWAHLSYFDSIPSSIVKTDKFKTNLIYNYSNGQILTKEMSWPVCYLFRGYCFSFKKSFNRFLFFFFFGVKW